MVLVGGALFALRPGVVWALVLPVVLVFALAWLHARRHRYAGRRDDASEAAARSPRARAWMERRGWRPAKPGWAVGLAGVVALLALGAGVGLWMTAGADEAGRVLRVAWWALLMLPLGLAVAWSMDAVITLAVAWPIVVVVALAGLGGYAVVVRDAGVELAVGLVALVVVLWAADVIRATWRRE